MSATIKNAAKSNPEGASRRDLGCHVKINTKSALTNAIEVLCKKSVL